MEVWTTTANGLEELSIPNGVEQDIDGINVTYFRRWTKDHSHFSPALLIRLIQRANKYDAIHIHSWWNLVAIGAVLACSVRGVRPVLSPRGMLSSYTMASRTKHFFHRCIGRHMLRWVSLHATTLAEADELKATVQTGDVFVLPNIVSLPRKGVETSSLQRTERNDEEAGLFQFDDAVCFRILFLSRIHPKKGLEYLFRALEKLRFGWRLTIAGEGDQDYENALRQLASELGITRNLRWYGWADQDAKFTLLKESDLFVLTSYNENFANVVLESLAVGTSVLLSEGVGLADWVHERQMGWLTPLTVNGIADALKTAYASTDERARIRREGPQITYETFDATSVARQYLTAYV